MGRNNLFRIIVVIRSRRAGEW